MSRKYIIIFLLFFLFLGNAVAPFILNDYHGNIIPVDSVDLEILNEKIIFIINENKIEADVKYEIANNKKDKIVGFIFPVYSNYKDDFEIYYNDKKIDFEIVDELFLKEILLDKWDNLKSIISNENLFFIDPVKKNLYYPEYLYLNSERILPTLYKFILNFKENSKNILQIKFKAKANEDRKIYPKTVYSYFYILNTKNYFKEFKNINIEIYYPKNYLFSANLNGETKTIDNKILYEINLNEINENLSFSYTKNRISNFSIFLYKKYPIFFSPYFTFVIIFIFFIILSIFLIIFIIIKLIKRKKNNV